MFSFNFAPYFVLVTIILCCVCSSMFNFVLYLLRLFVSQIEVENSIGNSSIKDITSFAVQLIETTIFTNVDSTHFYIVH